MRKQLLMTMTKGGNGMLFNGNGLSEISHVDSCRALNVGVMDISVFSELWIRNRGMCAGYIMEGGPILSP